MKRKLLAVPVILLLFTASLFAGERTDFGRIRIENGVGSEIREIHIAHTGTDVWSENLLDAPIAPNMSGVIPFDRSAVQRICDVKAVGANGAVFLWNRLALYNIYDIKLLLDGRAEFCEVKNAT